MSKAGRLSINQKEGNAMQITRSLLVVILAIACLVVAGSTATAATGPASCPTAESKVFADCPTVASPQTLHSTNEFVLGKRSTSEVAVLIGGGLLLVALTGVGPRVTAFENPITFGADSANGSWVNEIGKRLKDCYGVGIGAGMRNKYSYGGPINGSLTSPSVRRAGDQC